MVNMNRVVENMAAFIDEDMVPKMPKLEGITLAAMAPFVIKAKLPGLLKLVEGTELVSGDSVDIDRLYQEFKKKSSGKWPIEMLGFKFYENDLDTLYRYMLR